MSFAVKTDNSKCTVTLYHTDNRVSDTQWCDATEVSFSKQTANKANDLVASYFSLDQEWDKKLLKCIFLDDINYDWFHFHRMDTPDITLGVKISGNRNIVFNETPEEFYVPVKRPGKLSVVFTTRHLGNNDYDLDYDEIRTERNKDYSVVALFNCNSFKRFTECSTQMKISRTLEKIDISESEEKSNSKL